MRGALGDEEEIRRLVGRFANAFDLKAWDALEGCLAESVVTDYSDLRGTPPATISRRRFVELRRAALETLRTHHLGGNHEITVDGDRAECRASMVIWRRDAAGRVFNTHCLYRFGLARAPEGWRIASVVQTVLWNDGEASVHGGTPHGMTPDRERRG